MLVDSCVIHRAGCARIFILLRESQRNIAWLVGVMSAYLWNKVCGRHLGIAFLHDYFNDLLAMPAMLAYSNLVLAAFQKPQFVKGHAALYVTCICGLLWEVVALWLKPNSVCDWLDFLCYFIGATLYYISLRSFGKRG